MRRILLLSLGDFIIDVVISGIVSAILQRSLHLDTHQGIVLGLILLITLLALQIKYRTEQSGKNLDELLAEISILPETKTKIDWIADQQRVTENLNGKLRVVSDGIKQLSIQKGSEDLFVHWYFDKIESLRHHLQHTLDTESFDFDAILLDERRRVLDILKGRETDFFWAISSCKSIQSFLTTEGNDFVGEMDKRFQARTVISIQELFVYDHKFELEDIGTKLFFCLHEQSGYQYRIIDREDFDAVYRAFGDKSLAKDFGVYGTNFVWETTPDDVFRTGILSRSVPRITRYKRLYEKLWETAKPNNVIDVMIIELCKGQRIGSYREILASSSS